LYYSVRNYPQAENAARNALTSDVKNTTALEVLAGVAFDKNEGVVKAQNFRAVVFHRVRVRVGGGPKL
jgi:hypothetical protein